MWKSAEICMVTGFFTCKEYILNVDFTPLNLHSTRKSWINSWINLFGFANNVERFINVLVDNLGVFFPCRGQRVVVNSIQYT